MGSGRRRRLPRSIRVRGERGRRTVRGSGPTALEEARGGLAVARAELAAVQSRLGEVEAELARRQSFTDALLETIDVGIVSCDADGVFVVSNRAQRAMFGLTGALTGKLPEQLPALIEVRDLSGAVFGVMDYPLMRALRGEDVAELDVLVGPAGGPLREAVVRSSQIVGADGEVLGAVAALSDVTAERTAVRALAEDFTTLAAARAALEEAKAFSDAILAASPDDTLVTDVTTGTIIYASPGKHVLGRSSQQLQEMGSDAVAELIHPLDRAPLRALSAAANDLADGEPLQTRVRGLHADGGWRWLSYSATPFRRDAAGRPREMLAIVRDVTELVEAEELLTYAALHDSLTGLPNRAHLIETLESALARSEPDGREVAVLFCDLDGFKRVNDTGGHSAGDAVLVETAKRLRRVLRTEDVVARVGGDEFVVVVEPWNRSDDDGGRQSPPAGETVRAQAVEIAQRITAAVSEPITIRGLAHVVTASIGVTYATHSVAGTAGIVTVDVVLDHADAAMYQAKSLGKNRFEVLELAAH